MADADETERFNQIWHAHNQLVARFIARRLPPHEDGADLVSEVFLTAWRRLDELPPNADLALPWLYGVARKSVANRLRGARRSTALQARLAAQIEEPDRSDATPNDSGRLVLAFNGLSARDREAIALVTWEELAPRQAAEVIGISAARFRVRLHRAKQRLRDRADAALQIEQRAPIHPTRPQSTESQETP